MLVAMLAPFPRSSLLAPVLAVTTVTLASVSLQAQEHSTPIGVWESKDKSPEVLRVDADRIAYRTPKEFRAFVARIDQADKSDKGSFRLNFSGIEVAWGFEIVGDELRLWRGKKALIYARQAMVPAEFEPKAMKIPKPKRPTRRQKKSIQKELLKRVRKDQQARNGSTNARKLAKLDADNTEFLIKTVGAVGWIDVGRFGAEVSNAAWLLTTHCNDLTFMIGVLPEIEKDVTKKRLRDGENYAALYDRVQMFLGHKQRYGTQIVADAKGKHMVFSLEDPKKVDAWRRALRLSSLAESLKMHEKWTGGPIRLQDGF